MSPEDVKKLLDRFNDHTNYEEFAQRLLKGSFDKNTYGKAVSSQDDATPKHQVLATLLGHNAVMAQMHPSVDYFSATEVLGKLMLLVPSQEYQPTYPGQRREPTPEDWPNVARELLLTHGATGHDVMIELTHRYTWRTYVESSQINQAYENARAGLRATDLEILATVDARLFNDKKDKDAPQKTAVKLLVDAMVAAKVFELSNRASIADYVKMVTHYDNKKNEVFVRFLAAATKVVEGSPAHPRTLLRDLVNKDLGDTGGQRTQRLREVVLATEAIATEPDLHDRLRQQFDARKKGGSIPAKYIIIVNMDTNKKYNRLYLSSLDYPRQALEDELVVRLRAGTRAGGPHPQRCNVVCDYTDLSLFQMLTQHIRDRLADSVTVACDKTSAFGTVGNLASFLIHLKEQEMNFEPEKWDLLPQNENGEAMNITEMNMKWVGELAKKHNLWTVPQTFNRRIFSINSVNPGILDVLGDIVRDGPSWAIVFEAAQFERANKMEPNVFLRFTFALKHHAEKTLRAQLQPLKEVVEDLERLFKHGTSEKAVEAVELATLWQEVHTEFWELFQRAKTVDDARSAAYMAWSLVADAQALLQIEREGLVNGDLWLSGKDITAHGAGTPAPPAVAQPAQPLTKAATQPAQPAQPAQAAAKAAAQPAAKAAAQPTKAAGVGRSGNQSVASNGARQAATPAKTAAVQPAPAVRVPTTVPTPEERNYTLAEMVSLASRAMNVEGSRILTLVVKNELGEDVVPENLMRNFRAYFAKPDDINSIDQKKISRFADQKESVQCYVSKDLRNAHAATIIQYQTARSTYKHGVKPDNETNIGTTTAALRRTAPHMLMVGKVQILHDFRNGNELAQPYRVTMFYNVAPEIMDTRSGRAYRVDLGLKLLELPSEEGKPKKFVYDFDVDRFIKYYKNIVSFYMRVAAIHNMFLFIPTPQIYFRALNRAGSPSIRFVEAVYHAANDPANISCPGVFIAGERATSGLVSVGVPVVQVGGINALALVMQNVNRVAMCVMGNVWIAGSAALQSKVKAMEEGLTRLTGPQIPLLFSSMHNKKLLDPKVWHEV